MSATCTFCGGNLAPGVLHDPKQCAPVRGAPVPEGLDFERAFRDGKDGGDVHPEGPAYRAALNAQLAERIAAARAEEREHMRSVLERWGWTPMTCPAGHVGCFLPPGHDHLNGPCSKEAR